MMTVEIPPVKLKIPRYSNMNNGSPKKVNRIIQTFRVLDPSVLNIYVKIIRKSMMSAIDITVFMSIFVRKISAMTIRISAAYAIGRREYIFKPVTSS